MSIVSKTIRCMGAALVLFVYSYSWNLNAQQDADSSPHSTIVTNGDYQLCPQDSVRITVFHEDDLTTETRISADGTIQFPLIGTVHIGGKNIYQAGLIIEQELKKDYFVAPQVSVMVTEFGKRQFAILGQVKSPGTYELPAQSSCDLMQAIAIAGGFTRSANPSKITVKRLVKGQQKIFRVNGKELTREDHPASFPILTNDTIIVAENFF